MLAAVSACSSPTPAPPAAASVQLTPTPARGGDVVARVNGVPILAQDLATQMQQAGQDRNAAVQALVREELLAQEAARRGLHRHRRALQAQRRALANLLTRTAFARRFSKKDIPLEQLREAYKRNPHYFNRPELVKVAHILVFARARDDEAHHRVARRAAREVQEFAAAGRLSLEEFKQIRDLVKKRYEGLRFRGESLTTPRRGRVVPAFADAAFALRKPGDVSPVVGTRFGYHVIYLIEKTPEKKVPFESALPELRDRIYEEAKEMAFERWAEEVERRYSVWIRPDPRLPPTGASK